MNFEQLAQFRAVADALHFGKAAEELGMAQPHLSRAIARLEDELGARLFLRTSRRVQLTPAGRVFYAEAVDLLQAKQRAIQLTRQATQHGQPLHLGFVSAALYRVLPRLLQALRMTHPDLEVVLKELSTPEQLAQLRSGELDIGLGHPPVAPCGRITEEVLLEDRFEAVLPTGHALASQPSVSFQKLAAHPFILFPEVQGPALYAAIRDQCRLVGYPLIVAHTATRLHSQCSLVAAGLGVGLAPKQSRSLHVNGTLRRSIRPYPASLYLPLAAFWDARKKQPEPHAACLALLRQQAQSATT